jgi:hypothetical protein
MFTLIRHQSLAYYGDHEAAAFQADLGSLLMLTDKMHDHLIPLLATFTFRQRIYCLFPTPKCSLETYWERIESKPEMTMETSRWVYKQCSGIMAAIDVIHNSANNLDPRLETPQRRRHGAIIPPNILWFGSSNDPRGILVLSKMDPSRDDGEVSRSMIPTQISELSFPPATMRQKPMSIMGETLRLLRLLIYGWLVASFWN